ncbi:reverse transcriptase [Gossypium australe]|uniref:Reverse transcriptase n=1 Tax=Gossypium australe TaxID=47621 RepID=A0A5B6WX49_9ROSI|nr:reverse transcriptase [Gossypium australe]
MAVGDRIDYRQLNQLTIKDKFLMPIIEELLDKLRQAVWILGQATIKSECGSQIPTRQPLTHEAHYEFLSVLFFFDNILVYSMSWSNHLLHLKEVFHILRSLQLYAKMSKC